MMKMLIALSLLAAAPAAAKPATTVDSLVWLAGNWREIKGERWTEETWLPPRGGRMIGVGRSGKGPARGSFEFMRIEADADGTPIFWGAPSAGTAVPFRLVTSGPQRAVFENAAHDYPQRISYTLNGYRLIGETTLLDGRNKAIWIYEAAR